MTNTPYNGPRLPPRVLKQRLNQVIQTELTQRERETLLGRWLHGKTLTQLAQEQGINKSTACRTYHRAMGKVRRFLRYSTNIP